MKLPIIKARLRTKLNGPPLSIFNPVPIRKLWLEFGHQYAQTVTNKKLVIERIRKRDKKTYTSKIFNWNAYLLWRRQNTVLVQIAVKKKSGTFEENMMKKSRNFLCGKFTLEFVSVSKKIQFSDGLDQDPVTWGRITGNHLSSLWSSSSRRE